MAHYVVSLMQGAAGNTAPTASNVAKEHARGAAIYAGACADCHDRGRDAEGGALELRYAIALMLPTPANLIHIVRDGIVPQEHDAQPWMPAFSGALTAEQTADLVQYLRSMSGKPPWSDVASEVRRIEGESR
jgi:nicotinate dehydrogenase subunit B